MSKKKKLILGIMIVIIIIVAIACGYVNDYYHCDSNGLAALKNNGCATVNQIEEGYFLDGPGEETAMIFYPGAKVEAESYLPILYSLAEQGVDCFLIEMPCNLAILGKDKADDIVDQYDYENWYMSGHSLGGAMAASYSVSHLDKLKGIVFLAAYTTESLDVDEFSVLSIYGSEDMVLNKEKVKEGRGLVSSAYTEVCIKGGNHAYFGNYGEQEGDGEATITWKEQQDQTVTAIVRMITGEELEMESK